MRFGEIPIDEAAGAILAHSHRLEAKTIKKGRVLTPDDVQVLRDAGYTEVVGAQLVFFSQILQLPQFLV